MVQPEARVIGQGRSLRAGSDADQDTYATSRRFAHEIIEVVQGSVAGVDGHG